MFVLMPYPEKGMEYDGSLDSLPIRGEGRGMGFWGFQWRCLSRAWSDLRTFARGHVKQAILALVGASPALPLAARLGSNMTQELWSIVIQSFIGPAVVVAAGFLWFWMRAPFVLWSEAHAAVGDASAAVGIGLAKWVRSRDTFTLSEAAHLLSGQTMSSGEIVGVASGVVADIKRAIIAGKIVPTNLSATEVMLLTMHTRSSLMTGPPDVPNKTEISRASLEALAKGYGVVVEGLG